MFQAILLLFAVGVVAPAHATTHFVANAGTDSAACTSTAPCATISHAIVNAAPNDTIVCLDPISNFFMFINKSIDIECTGAPLGPENLHADVVVLEAAGDTPISRCFSQPAE
jgi:hypothetical protein